MVSVCPVATTFGGRVAVFSVRCGVSSGKCRSVRLGVGAQLVIVRLGVGQTPVKLRSKMCWLGLFAL
jgi:hypothetical protein